MSETAFRVVPVPVGCFIGCVTASEKLCLCRCGGENHGREKWQWPGLFCEDCGMSFGTKDPWNKGCYVQCGTSEKYLSRTGTRFASAAYCGRCYAKRHANHKAEIDASRRGLGYPVFA